MREGPARCSDAKIARVEGERWVRLRLMTYNVHDLRDDPDAVAHVMRSCDPDVVCLQEVPRRLSSPWRVGRLARETGLRWAAGGRGSGGTAVFTSPRLDLLTATVGRLPVPWLHRTRGYALAQVRLARSAPVTVASVHLSLVPRQRVAHVGLLLGRLAALPTPWLVGGDLNEPPGGPAWAAFGPGLGDAAGGLSPGPGARLSGLPAGAPTYPAKAPRSRIDAVLVSPDVVVERLAVAGASEHLSAGDLRAASDHLPLLADLRLPDVVT